MTHLYVLGSKTYNLKSENPQLLQMLDKLLPKFDKKSSKDGEPEIIDLDGPLTIRGLDETLWAKDNPALALSSILDRVLLDHSGYLWIDASALVMPNGQLALISGPSHSGKTTLSFSLALAHGWKILAEDIVLIDIESRRIAPFARPLSLRPDTKGKIKTATGHQIEDLHFNGWTFNQSLCCLEPKPAKFALAITLSVTDANSNSALEMTELTPAEYVRRLLTHSNAVRLEKGVDILTDSAQGTCYLLAGGVLPDRLETVLRLSGC